MSSGDGWSHLHKDWSMHACFGLGAAYYEKTIGRASATVSGDFYFGDDHKVVTDPNEWKASVARRIDARDEQPGLTCWLSSPTKFKDADEAKKEAEYLAARLAEWLKTKARELAEEE